MIDFGWSPETLFYGFLYHFGLHFEVIFDVFSEPRDLVIFATPPMQNLDFRGSEGPNLHAFGVSFSDLVLDLVFSPFWLHLAPQRDPFGTQKAQKGHPKNISDFTSKKTLKINLS